MSDLALRLRIAADTAEEMANHQRSAHLRGKAEGLRLALSYLEEARTDRARDHVVALAALLEAQLPIPGDDDDCENGR